MLSGYLGKGDVADRAFTRFARAYADQTEADHRALQQAVTHAVLGMGQRLDVLVLNLHRPAEA